LTLTVGTAACTGLSTTGAITTFTYDVRPINKATNSAINAKVPIKINVKSDC
jgi:hypothetical protein